MSAILSREDCYEVIRGIPDVSSCELTSYCLEPLISKSGFMGEHAILRVQLKQASELKELTFFVKSMSDVEPQKVFIKESGVFFKEEKMFCKIIPLLVNHAVEMITECVPKCFLVRRSEVFVFEDLSSRGYKILNQRESYSLTMTKIALNAVAKLHASSLILEEKLTEEHFEPYKIISEFEKEFREAFYTENESSVALLEAAGKGVATQIDLFHDQISSLPVGEFKKFAQTQISNFPEFVKPSKQFRNVICHGDLWAANIMFRFDNHGKPLHCYLVDFQSYRYCPPAQDVLTFIYLTTDRKFRKAYLEDAVLYYYYQLADILLRHAIKIDDIIPYEEFQQSCEFYKAFAISQEITHSQIVMMSPDDLEYLFTVTEYAQKIIYRDRSELISRLCKSDCQYRKKQCESILDLKDIFEDQYRKRQI